MAAKLTFREFAEFIANDVTINIFPDIVWPTECKLPKDKINWLSERLETLHTRYLENPDCIEDVIEETVDEDIS